MTQSPILSGFLRGAGIVIICGILGYLGVASNDLVFGAWGPTIAALAMFLDGLIEKATGKTAFGSVEKV